MTIKIKYIHQRECSNIKVSWQFHVNVRIWLREVSLILPVLMFKFCHWTTTGGVTKLLGCHFQTAVRGEGAKSGFRKEKPWKSSWLIAARISGSEGVSADGAAVKNLSKFSPFLPPC